MSELFEPNQMIAARTVAVEDKDIDVRLDMKRQKNAARIGKRVLRRLAKGKTHTVVRGGFLGIEKTTHVPETYGYMQGLLSFHGAEVEVYNTWQPDWALPPAPQDEVVVTKLHGKRVGDVPRHLSHGIESKQIYPRQEDDRGSITDAILHSSRYTV